MWKEFKAFAFKGNVIDMAVGVMIGGAFSKIVTSLAPITALTESIIPMRISAGKLFRNRNPVTTSSKDRWEAIIAS